MWQCFLILCGAAAFGQAAVESAILHGVSAGATTKAIGRLGERVGKAGAADRKTSTVPLPARKQTAVAKPYVARPVQASAVKVGLSRKDLLACCGEPTMRVSESRNSKMVETVWFTTDDKDELKVQIEDDVVTSVVSSRTARSNP